VDLHPSPQGGEKNFRRNLQGKIVSAPQHTKCSPPGRGRVSFFRTFFGDLEVGAVDLVVSGRLLRATSKKRVVNFFQEKSAHTQTKSWLHLCGQSYTCLELTDM